MLLEWLMIYFHFFIFYTYWFLLSVTRTVGAYPIMHLIEGWQTPSTDLYHMANTLTKEQCRGILTFFHFLHYTPLHEGQGQTFWISNLPTPLYTLYTTLYTLTALRQLKEIFYYLAHSFYLLKKIDFTEKTMISWKNTLL